MKADRTVIVIGAFLFIVGLAVAWNGYGYVQLERGWSLVISGTFAGCTGLILVALGLVLRELEAISSSASRATLLLAKGRNGGPSEATYAPPAYAPPLEEAAESAAESFTPAAAGLAPVAAGFAAESLTEAAAPSDGPLSWMVRANRAESSALKMPQAETSDEWLRKPLAGTLEEPVEQAFVPEEPELLRESAAEASEPAPPSHHEPELPPENLHEPEAEIAHRPEPEVAEAESSLPPEPEPEPEPAPEPEPDFEAPYEPLPESIAEPVPEPLHELAPEPATAEPDLANEPKPAIIGHYDAQGAHYTLYADGSIEAESAHGVYRFASMAELKRFIEGQA